MSPLIEVVCYTWQDVMVLDSKNFFVVAKLAIFISIEKRHKPVCTKSTYRSAVFFLRIQATMCKVSPSSQVSAGCSCVSGLNFHNSSNILCRVPRKLKLCQYSRNKNVDVTVIYFTVVLTSYPLNVWLSAELICVELTTVCGSRGCQTYKPKHSQKSICQLSKVSVKSSLMSDEL